MKQRQRFHAVMDFSTADRVPIIEFAEWWDLTLERWRGEGLPLSLADDSEIRSFFGLDRYEQLWISPKAQDCPQPPFHGAGLIKSLSEYNDLRSLLYPEHRDLEKNIPVYKNSEQRDDLVFWITLEGYFWFPRELIGIEPHLTALYEKPQLIHAINRDVHRFNLQTLEEICSICPPDFLTFAEDMSFNSGPMCSRAHFEEFLAPYYREIIPEIKRWGIVPFLDSDGDITKLVPWIRDVGFSGILPLERQAGVDVNALRREFPDLRMIGGFDKRVLNRGQAAIKEEFERLLPAMQSGGFIPSVDHQTPPGISLKQYGLYLKRLKRVCRNTRIVPAQQ